MVDYIRIIKETEANVIRTRATERHDTLAFRSMSIDLGRQTGKTYQTRKFVEECIKNGDKVLSIHSRFALLEDAKRKSSDCAKPANIHIAHLLENPSLAKDCRFVIFNDYGLSKDDLEKANKLYALLDDKNVGMLILMGRIL